MKKTKKAEKSTGRINAIKSDIRKRWGGGKEMKIMINKKEHALGEKEKSKLSPAAQAPKAVQGKVNVIDSYRIEADKAAVEVDIEKSERGMLYALKIPHIEAGTKALLDEIRAELLAITNINIGEISSQEALFQIKERFMQESLRLLREKLSIEKATEDFLVGMLMQDMLGLGNIEFLINDPGLEEVVIVNSKEPVRIYHKKYGWLATNIRVESEDEINNYANIIARRVGRQITTLTPLLDAHVITGDRANAVLYPIATKGNTLTIRKFSRDPFTIIDLLQNKTITTDISALLWLAIEYEMNVLVSGGTASGKTVFLNACMPFIPPNQRIISIEDTRELILPEFLYWCPLVTRQPNPEGKGEVSMLDLLVNSLRMRPDRIVLGEMRRQAEAEVLFEAMHTGHSVYATVHADTAAETIQRLANPPIDVPKNLLKAVNLNVVMFRDRRKGIRRILQIAEIEAESDEAKANIIYRYIPEKDEIVQHNASMNLFETLSRHTGMPQPEIIQNMKEKKLILQWLLKNSIRSLGAIGKVMNLYYTNRELLSEIIRKNDFERLKG